LPETTPETSPTDITAVAGTGQEEVTTTTTLTLEFEEVDETAGDSIDAGADKEELSNGTAGETVGDSEKNDAKREGGTDDSEEEGDITKEPKIEPTGREVTVGGKTFTEYRQTDIAEDGGPRVNVYWVDENGVEKQVQINADGSFRMLEQTDPNTWTWVEYNADGTPKGEAGTTTTEDKNTEPDPEPDPDPDPESEPEPEPTPEEPEPEPTDREVPLAAAPAPIVMPPELAATGFDAFKLAYIAGGVITLGVAGVIAAAQRHRLGFGGGRGRRPNARDGQIGRAHV
jgi:hypothetical protein